MGGWVVFQALPAESSNYTGEGANLVAGLTEKSIQLNLYLGIGKIRTR